MAFHTFILVLDVLLFVGSSLRLVESVTVRNDRVALLEFKKETYDPYGSLSSWNESIHFCNWVGVICGHRHQQRVIGLNLEGKGLGGSISPSIGNLTFLRFLICSNNSFHGKIPQKIGYLFRLQSISFTNNTLQGELPTSLANCTRLRGIHLSNNQLVGKILAEFASLSKLEIISINGNGLEGEIPVFFGNISSIQVISLGGNELQGSIPNSFGRLVNLYALALDHNNLSGMLPISLYNLSSLIIISLFQNRILGSFPENIGLTLPNLKKLEIGRNNFSRNIPNSISNISTLEILDLGENNFVGPVPHNLGNLQNLQWFSISENHFGARETNDLDFVNTLVNCTNIEVLGLRGNGFKGPLPNFKGNLSTQLSTIYLGDNHIFGTIPTGIEHLINLSSIGMEHNFLEGNIPSVIGKLPKLQALVLSENQLSGQIPSSIGNLTLLYDLHLDTNDLNATIPSTIGNCQRLQQLTLYDNNIQGPIPRELFLISSFSISLDLSYNSLVGSLPIEIGNLKSLTTIVFSNNKLSGEIPSSIGDCNSLEHLFLEDNFFEGTIPESLTFLKGLQVLDVSLNNLSGKIPKDLEKLAALRSLNLSFNNLEGEVPTKGIFENASAIVVNGNDKLCGGITKLRLPICKSNGSKKLEKSFRIIMVITSMVICFLLISSFLTLYWMRKSKSKQPSTSPIGDPFLQISYKELFQATGGFSSASRIGFGSFGTVYKGIIHQGETIVAIKVLNLQNPRVYKSFLTECKALRNIRHRNLVKILTSCSSIDSKGKDFKALVYEYMPNGSLDDWLHPPMEKHMHSRSLSLLQRLNIAIDVAFALEYLHYNCHVPIVHCDLKPSNVLLDSDMTAHVSDFGLARLLLEIDDNLSENQTSTIGIKGSIGYAAPEYGMGGKASVQGDIFSFGILLLEMFTGKKPTDQMFIDDLNLHKFAKASLPGHAIQILDPTLLLNEEQSGETQEGATRAEDPGASHSMGILQNCITPIIEIAIQCSMELPRERMGMNTVVKELHSIKKKFFEARI